MDPDKKRRLEAAGWQFGDAEDFLEMTVPERRFLDLRAKLGAAVRRLRAAQGITQKGLATTLGISQPRIVDIESTVSPLDPMFRAYFALGGELSKLDELGAPLSAEERAARVTERKKTSKAKS